MISQVSLGHIFYHRIEISELLRMKVTDYNRKTLTLIVRRKFSKIKYNLLIGSFLFAYGISVFTQVFAHNYQYDYNVWYTFVGNFVSGLTLFELFRRMESVTLPKWLIWIYHYIAKVSLAIFFLHMPVLLLLYRIIGLICGRRIFLVFLLWIMGFTVCLASSFLLGKNKWIQKYLLFYK